MKKAFAILSATAVVAALGMSAPAEAGKKTRNIVTGIVIGAGAAAILGAAANAAENSADVGYYAYDDDYDPRQNAVAACIHRTHRVLRGRGIEGVEVDGVRGVRPVGSRSLLVNLAVTTYDEDGFEDPANVTCRVTRDRVTRISIR
jgi:hypothetical protein